MPHEQDAFEPELAPGHRVSRPRGTGSVGDSVGEGASERAEGARAKLETNWKQTGNRKRLNTWRASRLVALPPPFAMLVRHVRVLCVVGSEQALWVVG